MTNDRTDSHVRYCFWLYYYIVIISIISSSSSSSGSIMHNSISNVSIINIITINHLDGPWRCFWGAENNKL